MRVAVLGGTGFTGRAVVRSLVTAQHRVSVLHRGETHDNAEPDDVDHRYVDRNDPAGLSRALEDVDAVIDIAAMRRRDAAGVVAALPHGARLIGVSSCDVYRAVESLHAGTVTDPVPIDETGELREGRYPLRGLRPGREEYEKLDVEEVYRGHGGSIMRLGFVIGAHDHQRREEPILRRIRGGRRSLPVGAGTFVGSRVLVDDVAAAMVLAVDAAESQVTGEVFNLVEASSPSFGLWARWILEDADADIELVRVPDEHLPTDLRLFGSIAQPLIFDSSKAREVLGWRPSDARHATRRSVAWHLQNPPEETGDFDADDAALRAVT